MRAAVGALLSALAAYGAMLLLVGLSRCTSSTEAGGSLAGRRTPPLITWPEAGTALALGLVALALTGWPAAGVLAAAAVPGLKSLGSGGARRVIAKLEAVAGWTEMLRDTLAGAAGLTQALVASAATAPDAVAEPVRVLAAKLTAGMALEPSLWELADDLDDSAADLVVAALLMAAHERAYRLGELLGALSVAIHEEVAMRLRIDAERASSRAAVRMIALFSVGFFSLAVLFARSYLAPYSSLAGQGVLTAVALLFGGGLFLMASMVRVRSMPRLHLAGVTSATRAGPVLP
jgi:tight adherence protein B